MVIKLSPVAALRDRDHGSNKSVGLIEWTWKKLRKKLRWNRWTMNLASLKLNRPSYSINLPVERESNLKLAPVFDSNSIGERAKNLGEDRSPLIEREKASRVINKTRCSFMNLVVSTANKLHCLSTAV